MLKSVEYSSMNHKTRGNWRKLFKARYNSHYANNQNNINYELILRRQIFEVDNEDIVINLNNYPYLFGDNMQQYVIWIREEENDPGIDWIFDTIKEMHPNMDIMIYINDPLDRSIKSILHYHAIIKNPSPPLYLQKLIIFNSCRTINPEFKIPLFEEILYDRPIYEGDVLSNYYTDFTEYVHHLINTYELDTDFILQSIFLATPNQKYQKIPKLFADAFKMHAKSIHIVDYLDMENILLANEIVNRNDTYHHLYQKYSNVITHLENIICLENKYSNYKSNADEISALWYVCSLYHTIQTYKYLGINVDGFISEFMQSLLTEATTKIYNYLCQNYSDIIVPVIEDIIHRVCSMDSQLIHCTTDNKLLFILAKYYGNKKGFLQDLEIPESIASVRIEEWSDGIRRVYYNNWLLSLDTNVN